MVKVKITKLKPGVRRELEAEGFIDKIGPDHIHGDSIVPWRHSASRQLARALQIYMGPFRCGDHA